MGIITAVYTDGNVNVANGNDTSAGPVVSTTTHVNLLSWAQSFEGDSKEDYALVSPDLYDPSVAVGGNER